jgi:hypothetical protein
VATRITDEDYVQGNVGFFVETFDETLAHIHYDTLTIKDVEIGAVAEPLEIHDDFTDPSSGWPVRALENSFYGYHPPDYYHVEVHAPRYRVIAFQLPSFADVTVETEALVDHTDTEAGDFRYGLAVRQKGSRYYAFVVSPRSGTWSVLKSADSHLQTLAEGPIETLQGLAAPDVLRVDAIGANFVFAVNDQVVAEIDDAEYASGSVGFYVETFDESLAHIHYDSVAIREIE